MIFKPVALRSIFSALNESIFTIDKANLPVRNSTPHYFSSVVEENLRSAPENMSHFFHSLLGIFSLVRRLGQTPVQAGVC